MKKSEIGQKINELTKIYTWLYNKGLYPECEEIDKAIRLLSEHLKYFDY